jgi:predicted transcriptional regulator
MRGGNKMDTQQITLKRLERPQKRNLEQELDAFCKALAIPTDDQSVAKDIFLEILQKEGKGKEGGGMRSIIISKKMRLTRGGTVYHLNKLMESGLIVRRGREYELRAQSLEETVDEMEDDMRRMFKMVKRMAAEIDEELGIERY